MENILKKDTFFNEGLCFYPHLHLHLPHLICRVFNITSWIKDPWHLFCMFSFELTSTVQSTVWARADTAVTLILVLWSLITADSSFLKPWIYSGADTDSCGPRGCGLLLFILISAVSLADTFHTYAVDWLVPWGSSSRVCARSTQSNGRHVDISTDPTHTPSDDNFSVTRTLADPRVLGDMESIILAFGTAMLWAKQSH